MHLGYCAPSYCYFQPHLPADLCRQGAMVAGLLQPDSNRPVRPLGSGPDGYGNHWRPGRGALGREG